MEQLQQAVDYVPTALVLASQVAAVAGTPKVIKKVKVLHGLWNLFTANYGKAQNAK